MRRLWIPLAALAAALVVLAVLRAGRNEGVGAVAPAAEEPEPPAAAPRAAPAERDEGGRRVVDAAEAPSEGAAPRVEDEAVALAGTIVVLDANGAEHARESGLFTLFVYEGRGGRGVRVAVDAGAWTARVPRDAELRVDAVELGGRHCALLEPTGRFSVPEDARVALRVEWFRETLLHVRDAPTNAELSDVTVLRAPPWPRSDLDHPGDFDDERVVLRAADSPIALAPSGSASELFHVGAPGHAWSRLALEAREGGERVLALERGAGLEVELAGGPLDAGSILRLRRGGPPYAELDLRDRRSLALDGLPLGTTRVSVEVGPWWNEPLVLGAGEVEIREGERAFLRLEVEPPPPSDAVPFAGEIVLPAEWELAYFMLVVKLLDPPLGGRESIVRLGRNELERAADPPELWRFALPDAQPGRYELELHPLYYSISLELGPAGREDVRFEIPPPAEALVRVQDAFTGRDIEAAELLWCCRRPQWVRGGGLERLHRDAETGAWLVRAPRTAVDLHARAEGYASAVETVELGTARIERTLRLEPSFRIVLRLRDGATPVAWPRGATVEWRAAAEDEPRRAWSPGGESLRIGVPAPGEYLLGLPEIGGYERVPEQRVTVGPEGMVELAIELERRN